MRLCSERKRKVKVQGRGRLLLWRRRLRLSCEVTGTVERRRRKLDRQRQFQALQQQMSSCNHNEVYCYIINQYFPNGVVLTLFDSLARLGKKRLDLDLLPWRRRDARRQLCYYCSPSLAIPCQSAAACRCSTSCMQSVLTVSNHLFFGCSSSAGSFAMDIPKTLFGGGTQKLLNRFSHILVKRGRGRTR